jgi:hypothetical protein
MNNQEVLILVLIVVLIVIRFYHGIFEQFETDPIPMLCKDYPLNSNCVCPPEAPVQTVLGQFPMNYGEKSPYVYTCVPSSAQEPETTIWPNPPE